MDFLLSFVSEIIKTGTLLLAPDLVVKQKKCGLMCHVGNFMVTLANFK